MTDLLHSDLLERATDDDRARLLIHLAEGLPKLVIPPSLRDLAEKACSAASLSSHAHGPLLLAARAVQLGIDRVAARMGTRTKAETMADDAGPHLDMLEAQTLHHLADALFASSSA